MQVVFLRYLDFNIDHLKYRCGHLHAQFHDIGCFFSFIIYNRYQLGFRVSGQALKLMFRSPNFSFLVFGHFW